MMPGWVKEPGFSEAFIQDQKRIYPSYFGGFVISDHLTWLPGAYETFEAAALAFTIPDDSGLRQLNEDATVTPVSEDDTPDYRLITLDQVKSIITKYYS